MALQLPRLALTRVVSPREHLQRQGLLGRVTNVVDFGLFVDIAGPTDGLVHISNVERGYPEVAELRRRFSRGDEVDVRLTGIDRAAEELDLVLVHHG